MMLYANLWSLDGKLKKIISQPQLQIYLTRTESGVNPLICFQKCQTRKRYVILLLH